MIWDKIPWVEILLIFCALSLFWIYYDARRFHKYMVNALHKETKRRNTHDSMIYELIAKISSKGDSEIKLKEKLIFIYEMRMRELEMEASGNSEEEIDVDRKEQMEVYHVMFNEKKKKKK